MAELETVRHARERGDILQVLKEDYAAEMTSVRNLLGALDALGVSLSAEGLGFHLTYLADGGYIRLTRARDVPGYRKDRRGANWQKPETIMFAKLLPKGLHLIDGRIAEDPGIRF